MALILIEGFDHEADRAFNEFPSNDGNQLTMKGWSVSNLNNYGSGRFAYSVNSRSIGVFIDSPLQYIFSTSYSNLIIGFGFRTTTYNSRPFLYVGSSMSLNLTSTNRLQILDSGGGVVATGTTQLNNDTWYYIEVQVVTGGTGSCEVRLNGVSGEIPSTVGGFGGTVNNIQFSWQHLFDETDMRIDDVYVLDPTTGTNTDFLGDVIVQTLYPNSDGTYTDWTPDTGSSHYQRVDEGLLDADTSYVHTTTASAKDSYGFSGSLTNTLVYGVQLNLGIRKNDASGRTIKPLIRQSGTDYLGPLTSLGASYTFHSWLLDQDPSGSDWLYTTVNGDEYGIELVS